MDTFSLLLLACGLAMDAFSVAVTIGMTLKKIKPSHALKVGLCFGSFQLIMILIGSFITHLTMHYIEMLSNALAFSLLLIIGVNMIITSFKSKSEMPKNPLKASNLFIMSIATSIDALAAGITLGAINSSQIHSACIVGITAFIFSASGVYIGHKSRNIINNRAELIGGIILIIVAIKIFI